MQVFPLFPLILLAPVLLSAQAFQGEFVVPTSAGEIVLRLHSNGGGQYSGVMIGDNGEQYPLQAQGSEAEGIGGILTDPRGAQMVLQAFPAGTGLTIRLIPVDDRGQPMHAQATEFAMQRRTAGPAPGGSLGGPLGNGNAPTGTESGLWTGTFSGNIEGTPTSMSLQQQGNQVSGTIDAAGYRYTVQGQANGNQLQGRLDDPQTGGQMPVRGSLENDRILLDLQVQDAYTGQTQYLQMQFQRGGAMAATPQSNTQPQGAAATGQRDTHLVGNWLYSESYTSGEYSFASQWRLLIQPDGTYLYGDAKVAGGGPGTSASSEGSGYSRGQWRTENNTIYINEGGGWQPYAGYYVEGNSLMLTFGNGKRQVWQRN